MEYGNVTDSIVFEITRYLHAIHVVSNLDVLLDDEDGLTWCNTCVKYTRSKQHNKREKYIQLQWCASLTIENTIALNVTKVSKHIQTLYHFGNFRLSAKDIKKK